MYVEDMVVKDIIELRLESDNIPSNATLSGLYEWYTWAFNNGLVEVLYRHGELQGYIEWLSFSEIPESKVRVQELIDGEDHGNILYINTCCVRDDDKRHGTLWRLIHIVREKYPNFECVCWHRNGGAIQVYDNINKEEQNETELRCASV